MLKEDTNNLEENLLGFKIDVNGDSRGDNGASQISNNSESVKNNEDIRLKQDENEEDDSEEDDYFAEIERSKANRALNANFKYQPFESKNKFCKDDLEFMSTLGNGAYAKVMKAKIKKTGEIVAVKIINKAFIEKECKVYQIYLENEVLGKLFHQNIIKILGIYEEPAKVNIVLEFCSNGDFGDFIMKKFPFSYDTIQFYTSQIVNALEYMHNYNVFHRDFKPENIMLDEHFHIKIIDFGTAKIHGKLFDKTSMKFVDVENKESLEVNDNNEINALKRNVSLKRDTFVGTAEYVSPEMLLGNYVSNAADLWSLGCIIYKMFTGSSPFKDKSDYLTFARIKSVDLTFPPDFPETAADLVKKLLVKEPDNRLGSGKPESNNLKLLKSHDFFKGVNFVALNHTEPPFLKENNNKRISLFPKANYPIGMKITNQLSQDTSDSTESELIKEGRVSKKSPYFFYNTRQLRLTSDPKLEYIDFSKNQVKGIIYLSKECRAEFISKEKFELITPTRRFTFKAGDDETGVWVKSINDAIEKYAK